MKTAVEWLVQNIGYELLAHSQYEMIVNKAKEMEKQQIMIAYDSVSMNTSEQYYNETYRK